MKFLEKLFVCLAVIGLFIRLMMWEGGELFLTVSLPSLAILYLLMSWSVFRDDDKRHNIFLSVLSGLSFCIIFIGLLFKLMIWRSANILLETGLVCMAVSKIVGLLLKKKHADVLEDYFRNLFLRYYIIAALAIIVLLVPYKSIAAVYHRDDPEYVRLFVRFFDQPKNKQYRAEFYSYRRKKNLERWHRHDQDDDQYEEDEYYKVDSLK